MKIIKLRTEPLELTRFRYLNNRMNLSSNDKQYFHSLQKGYEGEIAFV